MALDPHPFQSFTSADVRAMREATGDGMYTCLRRLRVRALRTAIAAAEDVHTLRALMLLQLEMQYPDDLED
jgi:hypothetical protein